MYKARRHLVSPRHRQYRIMFDGESSECYELVVVFASPLPHSSCSKNLPCTAYKVQPGTGAALSSLTVPAVSA